MGTKRALLSVANKEGLARFARGLKDQGFEIVSSGGTARSLSEEGIAVTKVAEVTGFPEILGGRVKTLNPRIHGGILARREVASDREELEEHGIVPVEVVAVNFYPFERKLAEGSSIDDLIEHIDIGGPSMLRAAAKNFRHVLAVNDPQDYDVVLEKLAEGVDMATRVYLAAKAFRASARYEAAIAGFVERLGADGDALVLEEQDTFFPTRLLLSFEKAQDLRYGENPHQSAAFYRDSDIGVGAATQLHGKELSYNNILDLDAAFRLVSELPSERAAACVIKHTNPAGAAVADDITEAYVLARETDPVSAFGGIVALNRPVGVDTAEELTATFLEAVIAPGYEAKALEILKQKKNLRLMKVEGTSAGAWPGRNFVRVLGGLLVQDWDRDEDELHYEVATEREPTAEELKALRFAWTVAKHVKSNAIVIANERALLGVGAGQMSRVDSCRIAIDKARSSLEGSVAASDAFFPFRDGVDTLAQAGVKAVIQPGGSVRDEEVIQAANEHGVTMLFTGKRHFRH